MYMLIKSVQVFLLTFGAFLKILSRQSETTFLAYKHKIIMLLLLLRINFGAAIVVDDEFVVSATEY